jgi:hypothetical protein
MARRAIPSGCSMTRQPKTMGWSRTRGAMTSRVHRPTLVSERSLRPDCAKAWPSCCAAVAWDGQAVDLKAAGCQSAGWRWAAAARPSLTERRSRSDGRTAQDRTWFGPRSSAWAVLGRVDASGCCSRRHHLTERQRLHRAQQRGAGGYDPRVTRDFQNDIIWGLLITPATPRATVRPTCWSFSRSWGLKS